MGIYCIAAGSASTNRLKTLDRSHAIADLEPYLSPRDVQRLREHFPEGHSVFLWGANRQGQLPRVRSEEFVIDFNDQRVDKVFQFCFFISTGSDTRLQRFVGWDEGSRSTVERRPYSFVYFLKKPIRPQHRDKPFFLRAFGAAQKPHFFDGQKYLDDTACAEALRRMDMGSVMELLGLASGGTPPTPEPPRVSEPLASPPPSPQPLPTVVAPPPWLSHVVTSVQRLWDQRGSLERDHEHAVAQFLEALGYRPAEDIRFQRANIDIVLAQEGRTLAVIEVKADRALTSTHRSVLGQAFGYALEAGAPIVIITNGNYYAVFDRRAGLSREDSLLGEFRLLYLDAAALATIERLRRGVLK